tara:strand:+ start:521 stop:682 length:162 start_codon:yes stop_codon:yes gene_type:complete
MYLDEDINLDDFEINDMDLIELSKNGLNVGNPDVSDWKNDNSLDKMFIKLAKK